jgi:hypothetical protein
MTTKMQTISSWSTRIGGDAAIDMWNWILVSFVLGAWWLIAVAAGVWVLVVETRGIGWWGVVFGAFWTVGAGVLTLIWQSLLKRARVAASRKLSYAHRRVIVVPPTALRGLKSFDRWFDGLHLQAGGGK